MGWENASSRRTATAYMARRTVVMRTNRAAVAS